MKTFSDLTFVDTSGTKQAIIRFDNGYGVSVLQGCHAIADEEHPYELAVLQFSTDNTFSVVYPSFTQNDILGRLDSTAVTRYMRLVQCL